MTPIIGFAGFKHTGKTTLVTRLIAHYTGRGLRVGVIKHDAHGFAASAPGTDTDQFAKAGAQATAIASPDGHLAFEWRLAKEPLLADLVSQLGLVDVVFVEGYKHARMAKWVLLEAAQDGLDPTHTAPYEAMMVHAKEIIGWVAPYLPFAVADPSRQVYHRDDIEAICNQTARALSCPFLRYGDTQSQ